MKPNQSQRWYPFLALFVFCYPAIAQLASVNNNGDESRASRSWTIQEDTAVVSQPFTGQASSSPQSHESAPPQPYGWHTAIYPVLGWAPIFGASFTLPPTPSNPIETPSGSTDTSFNGAYFGGARFEPGKWSADILFMWAALHAERTTPFANLKLDFVFGDAMIGREILPDLYLEGGFRRLALNIDAAVESESAKRSPGYWDPLVGLTYRRQLGNKWRIEFARLNWVLPHIW
jgi:hypothetical protein